MKPTEDIKYNIDQIYSQGGKDNDVEAYLKSEGVNPSDFTSQKSTSAPVPNKESNAGDIFNKITYPVQKIGQAGNFLAKHLLGVDTETPYGNGESTQEPTIKNVGSLMAQMGSDAAKATPLAFNPTGSLINRMYQTGLIQGGSKFGSDILGGKGINDSGKDAFKDMLLSSGLLGATELGGIGLKKGISAVGSKLSGIDPYKYGNVLEREIQGPSAFGTSAERGAEKWAVFDALKEKEQAAIDLLNKESPKVDTSTRIESVSPGVFKFNNSTIQSPQIYSNIDSDKVVSGLNNLIDSTSSSKGVSDILSSNLNTVKNAIETISKDQTATGLDRSRNLIQNQLDLNKIDGLTKHDTFLRKAVDVINSEIKDKAPDLYNANKEFALSKNADLFENWRPNVTPYHGTALGAGMMIGHMAGIPLGLEAGIVAPTVLASSPKVNKGIIKTMGGIAKGYNSLPSTAIGSGLTNLVDTQSQDQNTQSPEALKQAIRLRSGLVK